MSLYIVPVLLISPHLNVWPYLSYIGYLAIISTIIGYFINYRTTTNVQKRRLPSLRLLKLDIPVLKSESLDVTSESLECVMGEFLTKMVSNQINLSLSQLLTHSPYQGLINSFLSSKMEITAKVMKGWIDNMKNLNLQEKLVQGWLAIFTEQLNRYKGYRKELDSVESPDKNGKMRHLDDFNEYTADSADEASQWNSQLEATNIQIVNRMKAANLLHEVSGKDKDREEKYFRVICNEIASSIYHDHKVNILGFGTPSRLVKICTREWFVCQIWRPLFQKAWQPDVLNQVILDMANKRIAEQRSIRSFRNSIGTAFTHFPPQFLLASSPNVLFVSLPAARKLKIIDVVWKYTKRKVSLIDLIALSHEISYEIKRAADKIGEIQQQPDSLKAVSEFKKTIASFELLRNKIRKKIRNINEEARPAKFKKSGTDLHIEEVKPSALLLATILDDHYQSVFLAGGSLASSVFYFMEYLESLGEPEASHAIAKLKFWSNCENFRRLLWKHSSMNAEYSANTNDFEAVEIFSAEASGKLKKEAFQIYSKSGQITQQLPPHLLNSMERYIATLLSTESTCMDDDYKCFLKAQAIIRVEIDSYFTNFLHSKSYFKWTSESEKAKIAQRGDLPGSAIQAGLGDRIQQMDATCHQSNIFKLLSRELRSCAFKLSADKAAQEIEQPLFVNTNGILSDDLDKLTATGKDIESEYDIDSIAPGEFFTSTSKLSQLKEEINGVLGQIDFIDLLLIRSAQKSPEPHLLTEIHILEQTKEILRQEIGVLTQQKAKFESHEQQEAIMPGQCTVSIETIIQECEDQTAKAITYYMIDISRNDGKVGWSVKRRYSDFHLLHLKLRKNFPFITEFDLPNKTLGIWPRMKSDHQSRSKALEKYLQRLIDTHEICQSEELRNMLSSNFSSLRRPKIMRFHDKTQAKLERGFAKTISQITPKLKTARIGRRTSMMPNILKRVGKKDLDNNDYDDKSDDEQLNEEKALEQKFITSSDDEISWSGESSENEDDNVEVKLEVIVADTDQNSFSTNDIVLKAIIGLMLEVFDFKEHSQYLRVNAASMVLSKCCGRDLESLSKELMARAVDDDTLIKLVELYSMEFGKSVNREPAAVASTRIELRYKVGCFANLFSDLLSIETSQAGIVRLFEFFQNEVLIQNLIFRLLDFTLATVLESTSDE